MDKLEEEERKIQQREQEEDQRRPISPFSSGSSSEFPDPAHEENEDRKEGGEEVKREEGDQEPQNSIFSTEDHQRKIREEISQDVDGKEEEEDGYHTPTSPRHRIPAIQQCPGAPRQPKRKAGDRELYRFFYHVKLPWNLRDHARFVKKVRRN